MSPPSSLPFILRSACVRCAQRLDVDPVETLLVVTAVAVVAEFAVVNIVPPVAIDAAPAGFIQFLQGFVMTTVAMLFGVGMPQFEVRPIMIERPDQPVVRIVATVAILSQAFFVHVVRAMTIDAARLGIAEHRAQMAGLATGGGVLADQRKAGQVVIESHVL